MQRRMVLNFPLVNRTIFPRSDDPVPNNETVSFNLILNHAGDHFTLRPQQSLELFLPIERQLFSVEIADEDFHQKCQHLCF